MRLSRLHQEVNASRRKVTDAVNVLEQSGAVRSTRTGLRARDLPLEEVTSRAAEVTQAHRRTEQSRLAMMRSYAEQTGCRRQFLLGYFGEVLPRACGNCDNCIEHPERTADRALAAAEAPYPVSSQVQHATWGPGVVMSVEADRLTILFEWEGYRTLDLETVQEGDLLNPAAG